MVEYSIRITKDSDASFDIVDTLFMKASQVRPLHKSSTDFSHFLFKSCQNRSLNFLRSQQRRLSAHYEAVRQSDHILASIEEVLVKREEFGRALKAVESLPKGLQRIVVHSFINDLSAKEIAVIINVPEATVHSQKWQVLKRLRCSLTQ